MLDLAIHDHAGLQPLKVIARRTGITVKYLEQIIAKLVSAGLVRSSRGQSGGYTLARPADSIRLGTVLKVLEGSLAPIPCTETIDQCPRSLDCVTREIWQELSDNIWNTLEAVSLADMAARLREKSAEKDISMYHI